METKNKTLKEFMLKNHLEIGSRVKVKQNPNMEKDEWIEPATHWKITIQKYGTGFSVPFIYGTLTTYFSQGSAHKKPPTLEDILDCQASNASLVDNAQSFEDWAADLGYDPDSRKAEKIYNICLQQAQELKDFLGEDLYEELLYNTERL